MARGSESGEYGGRTFTVTKLPATRAEKIYWRLQGIIPPVLATGAGALEKIDMSKGLSAAAVSLGGVLKDVGAAAELLAQKMSPEDFAKLRADLAEFATVTTADGQTFPLKVAIDRGEFDGEIMSLLWFVGFALKVNFQDFWSALAEKFQAAAVRASPSPSTSANPGPTGD